MKFFLGSKRALEVAQTASADSQRAVQAAKTAMESTAESERLIGKFLYVDALLCFAALALFSTRFASLAMADAPQTIAPCDKCGGAGGLESFGVAGGAHGIPVIGASLLPTETRFRVKCAKCGHMTPHFGSAALCVTLWNSWAVERGDKLAG